MSNAMQAKISQFQGAVLDSFKFLESRYGFQWSLSRPNMQSLVITYETSALYVRLAFGSPEFEPEMSFGRQGIDNIPGAFGFEVGDLIQLDKCKNWNWNREYPKYPSHLGALVAEFARLLAECGRECLEGRSAVFEEMKARREKLIHKWRREEDARLLRSKIAAAWESKDYKTVVDLFSTIAGELSDLEKKKVEYAKNHV